MFRFFSFQFLVAAFTSSVIVVAHSLHESGTPISSLASQALWNARNVLNSNSSASCNAENLTVRKEWRTLTPSQRTDYIDAVLCLQSKPARLLGDAVPGAKFRNDDFTAIHMNQTLIIHFTAIFLSWHRYYVWLYERALKEECGYTGYQPYWEWSLDAGNNGSDISKSPLFDGSAYSLSGNGATFEPRNKTNIGGTGVAAFYIPPGTGGGCVTTGPFANMTVNLGPWSNPFDNYTEPQEFDYNPRCFRRDLNPYIISTYNNWNAVMDLVTNSSDIGTFQGVMQGTAGSDSPLGVHGGGHFSFGDDPGGDLFTSPGDPAFFFHHGQVDRLWWIWQNLDWEARNIAINGTSTFMNVPPSPEMKLTDLMNWGVLDNYQSKQIEDVHSTLSGPFCYVYE